METIFLSAIYNSTIKSNKICAKPACYKLQKIDGNIKIDEN